MMENPREFIISNRWTLVMWLSAAAGFGIGMLMHIRKDPYTSREVMYMRLVGELWLNAMCALALPLITTSIVLAIYELRMLTSTRLCLYTLVWVVVWKVEAVALAAVLAWVAGSEDGTDLPPPPPPQPPPRAAVGDCVLDIFRDALPENPVDACVRRSYTVLSKPPDGASPGYGDPNEYKPAERGRIYQTDVLGVVVASVAAGMAIVMLTKEGNAMQTLVAVSAVVRDTCALLLTWMLPVAGPCVALTVIASVAGVNDIFHQAYELRGLMWSTVLVLGLHLLVLYPLTLLLAAVFLSMRRRKLKGVEDDGGFFARVRETTRLLIFMVDPVLVALLARTTYAAFPMARRALLRDEEGKAGEVEGRDIPAASLVLGVAIALGNEGSAALVTAEAVRALQQQKLGMPRNCVAVAALGALSSLAVTGEAALHPLMIIMALSTVKADTTTQDIAPTLLTGWLMDALATAVNIMGSMVAAVILANYHELGRTKEEEEEEEKE